MQQHHGAAVRPRSRNIHIGHAELLAVIGHRQQLHGVGIGKAFERDAVGLARGGVGGASGGERRGDEGGGERGQSEAVHGSL
ncbi:hypothetical protein ACVWWR_008027 [Bradyrhizobium sp. LM3.2]